MLKDVISGLERAQLGRVTGFSCPSCGSYQSRGAGEPDTVLTCGSCGYFASMSEWASRARGGAAIGHAGQPPEETRISREGSASFHSWSIPPSGNSGGLLAFGWIWCSFTLLFTAGFIPSVLAGNTPEAVKFGSGGLPGWFATLFILLFLSVFWAIGLFMFYAGDRSKNASHRVVIGGGSITLLREWRGRKERSIPLADVKSIGQVLVYTRNGKPVRGIEIRGTSDKLQFGSMLAEAEKAWLVEEFRQAVWPEEKSRRPASASLSGGNSREVFSIPFPKPRSTVVRSIIGLAGTGGFVAMGLVLFPKLPDGGVPPFFRWFWVGFSGLVFLVMLFFLVRQIFNRSIERRLDGTATYLVFRKVKKGRPLGERLFDRTKYRDIRATLSGTLNGREMKRVELILGDKAERLASWVEGCEADAFVQEVRRVMG